MLDILSFYCSLSQKVLYKNLFYIFIHDEDFSKLLNSIHTFTLASFIYEYDV